MFAILWDNNRVVPTAKPRHTQNVIPHYNMVTFNQYDVVRVLRFHQPIKDFKIDGYFNHREPMVGDIATIVEIYSNPPGYELECCANRDGLTTWLHAFDPNSIELERVVGA